jgi:3-oxoacyl-[acyl-carrier protein] reductase
VDIDPKALDHLEDAIGHAGGRCFKILADATSEREVKSMAEKVEEKFGKVDILVNNIGGSFPPVALENMTTEVWEAQLKINLTSVFNVTRSVVGIMKRNKYGRIVNIASVAGRSYSNLGGVHYASAKHGVVGFTRQLARELAPHFIGVNAVAPGLVATERVLKKLNAKEQAERDEILDRILLRRPAQPEEIANAVIFLSSDMASYITGAVLDVNGGMLML